MAAIALIAAVITALVIDIQLLVAVVIVLVAAADTIIEILRCVGAMFFACFVSFSVLIRSAHAFSSSYNRFRIIDFRVVSRVPQ